jgi:TolB-like protein/Tfp pilus assembly protein PilF
METAGAPPSTPSSAEYVVGAMRRRRGLVAGLAAAAIIVAAGGIYWITREKPLDSLAVLPFVNMAADQGTDYLSDGIAESIISNLSQLPKLSVRSFSSVARFKNKDVSPEAAGKELKVRAVLTGRLVRRGDEFAISAELVDVAGDREIWGSQYVRKVDDLLAIQQQISQEISEKLRLQLNGADRQRMTRHTTQDNLAYQLYLQGRYQWNTRTLDGLQQSIDFFNQAIAKDPQYALAYAGLADAYALLTDFNVLPAREVMPKLQAAAAKALSLDDSLAEAHTSLAWADFHVWDWTGAEREFKRALELNPNYPTAHVWYGEYLSALGRFDEALPELNRALELNSTAQEINLALGYRSYYASQMTQAAEQAQKVLAADSRFVGAHVLLGRVYLGQSLYGDATAAFRKALELSEGNTNELAALGYSQAVSKQESEARKTLEELKKRSADTYVQPMWIAAIYTGLGDRNQAFEWLEKAYADRSAWLVDLNVDPFFAGVRSDPRFGDLIRRVGLTMK